MSKLSELQEQYDKYIKKANNPNIPESLQKKMKAKADTVKKEIDELDNKKKPAPAPTEKKEEKKEDKKSAPSATKAKDKDKPSTIPAKKGETVMTYKGKEVDQDTIDFCEGLIGQWRGRRASAKKAKASGERKRTTPVIVKVSQGIIGAAKTAMNAIPDSKIKADPKGTVKKFERLEKAADEFAAAFKEILGKKYKKETVDKELKFFETMIEQIKRKYKV